MTERQEERAGPGRLGIISSLSIAHELPAGLTGIMVPTVFTATLGLPVSSLWVFSIPLVVVALKWLWAPLVDRVGSDRFGRRRSWILPAAVVVSLLYLVVARIEPSLESLPLLIGLFIVSKFAFSTYEIATDAYVIESVSTEQRGVGSSAVWLGKEIGQIVGLAGTLIIADRFGWQAAFTTVALFFLACVLPVLFKREAPLSREAKAARAAGERASLIDYLKVPVNRRVLALTFVFAFTVQMVPAVIGPFLGDRGLSLSEVGIAIGIAASLGATLSLAVSSMIIHRLGPKRMSIWLIPVGLLALPLFLGLSMSESPGLQAVVLAIFVGAICTAPVRMAFYAARMGWTSKKQVGTDFTIQQSVWFLGYAASIGASGFIAGAFGWTLFFIVNAVLTVTVMSMFIVAHDGIERRVADYNDAA